MKYIITMIFFFISIFNYIIAESDNAPKIGEDCPNIRCGKNKPSKSSDCTKYGTDSGMLCCWYTESNTSTNGFYTLLSENKAEEKKINGDKTFIYGDYVFIQIQTNGRFLQTTIEL